MRRMIMLWTISWLVCSAGLATIAGQSNAETRYFFAGEENREYADAAATQRPTFASRVVEVNGHWRFLLQCYRVVANNPVLRTSFTQNRPTFQGLGYADHRDLLHSFAGRGVTVTAITRQPTVVYTLQLVAYQQPTNLHRFIAGLSASEDHYDYVTQIYRRTPKDFRLEYGDESVEFKDDPVYVLMQDGITRVRYGIYENAADAARDAAVWRRRFHVTPYITRVPLSSQLTRQVIWGDVPGIYEQRHFVQHAR